MPTDETQAAVLRPVSSMSPAEQRELLDSLLDRSATAGSVDLFQPKPPTLLRTPRKARGFQVRIDLLHVRPPIWRRLILPGDPTLDGVHAVLNQAHGRR